jgi:sulfur carrier protein ThiS
MKLILPDRSTRDIDHAPAIVDELLRELGFYPIGVMVSRNGTLVSEDALVENDDEIRIVRIAHGG